MANRFFAAIKARYFNTPADTAVDIGVNGDANPRLAIDAGGRVSWGDGNSPVDTNLYRASSNKLRTDDVFRASAIELDATEIFSSSVSLETDDPEQNIDITAGKSVKYIIHCADTDDYEVTEILAVKRNSSLNYTEYGKLSTCGNDLAEYDVALTDGNFYLNVTPSTIEMNFIIHKTVIT